MRNYTLRNGKAKTLTDEKLIDRVKAGDKQAESELIREVKSQISGVVSSYKKSFGRLGIDEDDAVQRLLLKVPAIVQTYDPEKNEFSSYVKTCARNLFNTICTKRKKTLETFVDVSSEKLSGYGDGGKAISEFESEEIVNKFFDEARAILNENEYRALVLFGNGYSYEEISENLGVERKKVDNLLYSARKKIKRNEEFFRNLLK